MPFKATEIVSLSVAFLAFVGSITSAFYTYSNRNRELDIKLVEIGIGILRADPKETGLTAARGWAVDVIEHFSGLQFSDADRQALLQRPLLFRPTVTVAPTQNDALQEILRQLSQSIQESANQVTPQQQAEMMKMMMQMLQNQDKAKSNLPKSGSPNQ